MAISVVVNAGIKLSIAALVHRNSGISMQEPTTVPSCWSVGRQQLYSGDEISNAVICNDYPGGFLPKIAVIDMVYHAYSCTYVHNSAAI